ncbi:MAG: ferrous iron transport protein A [Chloroflexi bacterium]|nr:ferrous iron transport protein A [Chloroflexota bacterium]
MTQTTLPLSELKPGEKGRIVRVGGEPRFRRRIMEMGMVKGETVKVEREAPLGDPVEFEVKGYHLSLRKSEAAHILVEKEEASA